MIKRDKILAELVFLLLTFLILNVFSVDLKNLFNSVEKETDFKPAKSFFWFMALLFGSFGNWLFFVFAYLIVGGIIYLIEKRE